jgi:D-alanyl-D-alanine dipeptidase
LARAAAVLAAALVASPAAGAPRVAPTRPIAELRREALAATPPAERGPFRAPDLVDLAALDPTLRLDVRYATEENFLGARLYGEARAFLQRPVAEAVLRAHRGLARHGYGLVVLDAYRPWHVTKLMWEATPPRLRTFVANPARGSRHNRGCAVDVTLYDLASGRQLRMPSAYDELGPRAHPAYRGGTSAERRRRDLLRREMERQGFRVFRTEWWHFDHRDWRDYPILNVPFDAMGPR